MYLVTGATGNVGSEVVAQLLAGRKQVRVFTRDAGKASHWGDRVQVVAGDFGSPESFARAADAVEAIFLMHQSPNQQEFETLIAAAKAAGGPRIVFLSSILAEQPQWFIGALHRDKEDAIRAAGLGWTFVRPGGFMSNAYQWIGSIRSEGAVYNAMGDGKFAPIAPEDIAAVAVRALTDSAFAGGTLALTGGELVDVPQQVNILAGAIGKPIRCVDVPVEAAIENFVRAGLPRRMAEGVGQSFEAIRTGHAAAMTETFESVAGRRPQTFQAWAQKHAGRFV